MKHILLPHQDKLIQDLKTKIHNNFYTIVTGFSGCGKSFAFQYLGENFKDFSFDQVIIFDSDYLNEERDYSAFKKSIIRGTKVKEYVKEGAIELVKYTPFVGNILSYIASSFMKPHINYKISSLNEEEATIIYYLKKIIRKGPTCIVCDNIHWWDRRSLMLLLLLIQDSKIFTEKELSKIRFVLSITDNQEYSNQELVEKLLNRTNQESKIVFPQFNYLDFKNQLYIETDHKLCEEQVELLYNLVNGHLKVFIEIIKEIKENSFDFDSSYDNNKIYLNTMLDRRLKEYGATGVQIAEVLEYASILGMTFSAFELEHITESTKIRIEKIIQNANCLNLTENTDKTGHYKFAHDIIREIFMSKVDIHHMEYYSTLASCLKEIKPGQYLRRARYMMRATKFDDAKVLYLLEFIYQLRTYGNIIDTMLEEVTEHFGEIQIQYLDYMKSAYKAYQLRDYNKALTYLNLILGYYPEELLAERDILKLRCYSKKLATDEIVDEIFSLESKKKYSSFNGEIEVWERYTHALITAYAHLGNIKKACDLEEELLKSLAVRLDFDDSANHRINTIKRNANAIHNIDISHILVGNAVNFFYNNNNYRDLKQYYTSLVNYSAVLIKRGEFLQAYEQTLSGFQLEKENPYFDFPRTQILKSNFIIAGILTTRVKISDGIELYHEILSELSEGMAERLFYTSNLSILYALNNDVVKAYEILNKEVNNYNIEADQEGLYRYRVITNGAIYQYLLGMANEAISCLEELDLDKLINGSFFNKKNKILIHIMRQGVKSNGSGWIDIVHNNCSFYQGPPWRYFGLGYAFAALCDWGV